MLISHSGCSNLHSYQHYLRSLISLNHASIVNLVLVVVVMDFSHSEWGNLKSHFNLYFPNCEHFGVQ